VSRTFFKQKNGGVIVTNRIKKQTSEYLIDHYNDAQNDITSKVFDPSTPLPKKKKERVISLNLPKILRFLQALIQSLKSLTLMYRTFVSFQISHYVKIFL
jgi:hypothetical protein